MTMRTTIGASEVAAILGLSPWQSPWDVWAKHVGLVEKSEGNNATRRGQILEPAIRDELARRMGVEIVPGPAYEAEPWVARDGWRHARPDGYVEQPYTLIEIKSTRQFGDGWGDDGTEGVPVYYACQVLWQLSVAADWHPTTGAVLAAFATFTDELRTFRLPYDEKRAAKLVAAVANWREAYILTGEPPPIDGSDGCRTTLSALYPADRVRGVALDPTNEDRALAADLARAKAAIATLEAEAATLQSKLCARIGDATEIRGLCKWAPVKGRSTLDSAALRKAHPDIADAFTRTAAPSRRFTLTLEE